jgi:hypothetical protein
MEEEERHSVGGEEKNKRRGLLRARRVFNQTGPE